ncbi:MAG: signal peptidase II [Candidatus Stahlbacteria bacterium]|nr:signal peptidase II [Candidatus Stahlbacteria bacterium]
MWRKIIALTLIIIGIDQLTKFYISHFFRHSVPFIGNFIRITPIQNPNAVFGLRYNIPLIPLTILAICIVVIVLYKTKLLVFSLILGGAIGNLIDRIRIGAVTDWIDVGIKNIRWPIFNIADAAITIGILWLIIYEIAKPKNSHDNRTPLTDNRI